jgi:hypothetical protein
MPKSRSRPVTMLNALKLSELLNKNTNPHLYPKFL